MDRLSWRKSSYSGSGGGNCVETASTPGAVVVRDSKDHGAGPVLRISPADWLRFTRDIK